MNKNQFHRKVLDNGMTILFEKRDLPVVSVGFAVRAGGVNEKAEEKGISHFIEHMLYKGTPTRNARQIAEQIEKNGGVINGFTDEEITGFWCKMPSKHLNVALDVLGDMIRNPVFDEKEIEKERKVIFEEIKMRKDNPPIYVFDKITSYLYKEPLAIPLIGNEKTLNSMNKKELVEKFKQIYQPNNLILCVVGNADFEQITEYAQKNFGKLKGEIPVLDISLQNKVEEERRKGIGQANLILAYHSPLIKDKKSSASEVLSAVLGGGMSSRLFSEIREKRNLAYSVKAGSEINKDFSYSFIYVGTTKENIEPVKELILKEIEKVSNELEEEELEKVKEQIIGNHQISIEDSQTQMVHLLMQEVFGNVEEYYNFEKNIREVKLDDVKELAGKAIKNYSFFALIPE